MKAILEFNLDDPDDRIAHRDAVQGANAKFALSDFSEAMRRIADYPPEGASVSDVIEKIDEEFRACVMKWEVNLD